MFSVIFPFDELVASSVLVMAIELWGKDKGLQRIIPTLREARLAECTIG
jgi:hypothetical protein